MVIIGAASGAAFGAWFAARRRSRASRDELGDFSGLPALGEFTSFDIDDDRAAEIIERFAPALEAVVRDTTVA